MKTKGGNLKTPVSESFYIPPLGQLQKAYNKNGAVAHPPTRWSADISRIQLFPRYAGGLGGLKGYSHIMVLFWVHRAKEWKMPKNHQKPPHVKLFATRMPVRPNPIGVSVVKLLDFSADSGEVIVKGLDALDGTPVLDIKPFIPNFDSYPEACVPDWVKEHLDSHNHSTAPGQHSHGN